MKNILIIVFLLSLTNLQAQIPFYYKIKKVKGELIQPDSSAFQVKFINRRRLEITGSKNPNVDTLLKTLTFTRIGRKYLEHLITSAAKIRIEVSDKVGIMFKDGKYRLIAGLTGPENFQSNELVYDSTSNFEPCNKRKKPIYVYQENSMELFRGSIAYFYNLELPLNEFNTVIFDFKTNSRITNFSMDTIKIEPIMHPDLMYKNYTELYYFAGIHEIFHTTPNNIDIQLEKGDPEYDAFQLERKLFRKRKLINRKKIK